MLSRLFWRAVRVGGVWARALAATLDGSGEYADAQAQGQQVEDHLGNDYHPGGLADRRDVPVSYGAEGSDREVERIGAGQVVAETGRAGFAIRK